MSGEERLEVAIFQSERIGLGVCVCVWFGEGVDEEEGEERNQCVDTHCGKQSRQEGDDIGERLNEESKVDRFPTIELQTSEIANERAPKGQGNVAKFFFKW